MSEVPKAQEEINALRELAINQEDHVFVDQEQAKLDAMRSEAGVALGHETLSMVQLPNGAIVPKSEVDQSRERGEESAVRTTAGRQV